MRDQARRLDENQKKLSDQLDTGKDRPQTSLRDTGERKKVTEGLQQQQKTLDKLLDQMRNTVQDAEETEPLLAKNLYDTVRKANEQKIPDALKAAEQLAELGVNEEAGKASRHAGQGIEQMREGVERSAKSVLGDEAAALRRAQSELEDLADQVNEEIAQATGQEPERRQGTDARNVPRGQTDQRGANPEADGKKATDPLEGVELAGGQPPNDQERQKQQDRTGGAERNRQGRRSQRQRNGERDQERQKGEQGQEGQQGKRGQQEHGQARGGDDQDGGQQQRGQVREQRESGRRRSLRGGGGADRPAQEDDRQFQEGPAGPGRPITGEGFRQWSDRMRDVEELLDNPELRAETARIRDRARAAREEFKRHAKVPDWSQLKGLVAQPINELRDRVAEEVRRRQSPDALVPIDRDPVPPQFAEGVRRYYERLGSGR